MTDEVQTIEPLAGMGGRKFALAVLALLLTSVLTWYGKVTGDVWQWVAIACTTGYASANVVQRVLSK